MQTLALVTMIDKEQTEAIELEAQRFRSLIIATHPSDAKKMLDILDGGDYVDESALFAPELTDEEMENYERLSHEEVEATIRDLRKFGLSVA